MELSEFEKVLKNAKLGYMHSYDFDIKVKSNKNQKIIMGIRKCDKCHKVEEFKAVIVTFKKEHKLTTFEAGLLYYLYGSNKKVLDCGGYHKCIAGKEFIENIGSIKAVG